MYTNIFRKFKTGGSVDASARNKASEIVSKASKNSKIPVEKLLNKLKSFSSDTEKQKFANLLVAASSDEESTEKNNAIKELQKKCNNIFENGGKMQAFICKHGHGGVNCGCGGKVVRGQEGVPKLPEGASRIITPSDTTDTYYLPNGNMVKSIHPTDGSAPRYREASPITIWDRWKTRNPKLQNAIGGFFSKLWPFAAEKITPEEEARYEEARRATFDGKVTSNQRGGTVYTPSMTYKRVGDVYGTGQSAGSGVVQPIIGEAVEIDGNEVFIPNTVVSASSMWGKDKSDIGVLYPDYGYAAKGMIIYTPNEIVARRGDHLRDEARVQNPSGLMRSQEDGGILMGQDGLSRKQVRADKRAVKRLMGSHNGYTAEQRYQSLMGTSRNYDQFAGMSRLERKNAINQYLLGNIKPNNGIGPISEVTDVEPGQSPNLSGYYESNNTSSYNRGYNNPEITFAYDKPAPIVIENQDQISPTSRLNDPDYVRRSTEAQWMLQRGIPIEELRKNPKYADVLEDPDEMRFGGRIKTSNINGSLIKNYKLNK